MKKNWEVGNPVTDRKHCPFLGIRQGFKICLLLELEGDESNDCGYGNCLRRRPESSID